MSCVQVGVGCQQCAKGTIATITEKNSDGTWNIPWGFYTKAYFANYKNTNPGNYQCSPCPLGTFSQVQLDLSHTCNNHNREGSYL